MDDVIRFIEDVWPVSEELKNGLKACLERREIKRNEILLMPGQVSSNIYFVSQGVLMKWHKNGAGTITTGFSMERDICVSCSSFFDQVVATEFIQAMEDTVVFCLSYKSYLDLVERYRELNHIYRKLFVRTVKIMENYTRNMSKKRAIERCVWLRDRYPNLDQRVGGAYIAQFLGMTAVTFCLARHKANALSDFRVRDILLSD